MSNGEDPKYTILCYGDSNTFGTCPGGGRWAKSIRWPGALKAMLGEMYDVVEEGCGGRTTVFEDDLEQNKNGRKALPVILASHKPIDLVVLMLGTNDLKHRFHLLPCDIAAGAAELVGEIRRYPYGDAYPTPEILLVSPILLGEDVEHSIYTGFTRDGYERSKQLSPWFKKAADTLGCLFLNAAEVSGPSPRDQLHMEADDHKALAAAICAIIRSHFEER